MSDFSFEYADDTPIKPVLSMREVTQDGTLEVPNPLIHAPMYGHSFKYLVEQTSMLECENFTVAEDLEPYKQFKHVTTYAQDILGYDYLPMPVREKQGEISLAMAAPVIGFLHKSAKSFYAEKGTQTPKILIVGAGVGKDIVRVTTSFNLERPFIVTVEPNRKSYETLCTLFPDDKHICGTFQRVWEQAAVSGPYDFIIANMSVHYILGLKPPGISMATVFSSLLVPEGVMYGSYVDIPSIKASGEGLNMKCGHSVMYLGDENIKMAGMEPVNSIARVAIGGVVWRDPWVTSEQIYKMFEDTRCSVQIFDGTQMVYTTDVGPLYPCPIPGFYKKPKRPEISVHRSLIVTRYHHTHSREIPPGVPLCIRDLPEDGLAMRHYGIPLNKGLPFGHEDLEYFSPDLIWAAEKLDGKTAYIIHSARSLTVNIEGEQEMIRFANYTSPYTKDFVLQAEAMRVNDRLSLVVTDVLVAPWGSCGNFISRWRWLESVYEAYYNKWPFVLQCWHRLGTRSFKEMVLNVDEGIVLQGLLASPSAIVQGAGSARYIKRVWTIEKQCGKGIAEYTLSGEFVRDRPDRTRPNPPHVIARIQKAMTYLEFCTYIGLETTSPGLREGVVTNIKTMVPVAEWAKPQLIWFFTYRCDPYLQYHCGNDLVYSYRLAVTEFMSKQVIQPEVFEQKLITAMKQEAYTPGFDFQ